MEAPVLVSIPLPFMQEISKVHPIVLRGEKSPGNLYNTAPVSSLLTECWFLLFKHGFGLEQSSLLCTPVFESCPGHYLPKSVSVFSWGIGPSSSMYDSNESFFLSFLLCHPCLSFPKQKTIRAPSLLCKVTEA